MLKIQIPSHGLAVVRALWLIATLASAPRTTAITPVETQTTHEDFASSPLLKGWNTFGNPDLFQWNANTGQLDVTWNSARSNSFLRLPLGTVLTRKDDFSVALDLQLQDIEAGVNEGKPGTFQIAFGFQNRAEAEKPSFIRGTGDRSPDLVEFNFFPDTGYGPTVWPAVFSSGGKLNYTGVSDFSIFELPTGIPMRVTLSYTASKETTAIDITTNGVAVGPQTHAPLAKNFAGFELDTLSISSYSDFGQSAFMPGSILAHGSIDNLVLTLPTSPIRSEQGSLVDGHWEHTLLSRTDWKYILESSSDLANWADASSSTPGTGSRITLKDQTHSPAPHRFFRVKAVRNP